jgi:hypothetical protein
VSVRVGRRVRPPFAILMAVALSVGCQPSGHGKTASDEAPRPPIPTTLLPGVSQAQRLGLLLFVHDSIGARATDAVHRKQRNFDPRVRGWLTLRSGEGWVVPFLTNDGGAIAALYRVRFASSADAEPEVEVLDNPEPVDETIARMFDARETAKHQSFRVCSNHYNTVVLPGAEIGQDGWLVYLLAATTEPGVVVSGGHHRFLVSADGRNVVDHFQFTKACLTLPAPKPPAGARVTGAMITHLTSETPTEVHVYLSLLHHMPFYVSLPKTRTLWEVDGRDIELIATQDQGPE